MGKKKDKNKEATSKKEDYYFNEDGFLVFTSYYLTKRGKCCKNGCKNCPWGYKKK